MSGHREADAGPSGDYSYPVAPQAELRAIVAFALSIASFTFCPFVAAIAALIIAGSAKRNILASAGRTGGLGLVTAARVIAWTNIVLSVVAVVLVAVLLIAVGGSRVV